MIDRNKELVEKAIAYLKDLIPNASNISFEELGFSLSIDNPPNAVFIVLSYKDLTSVEGLKSLFSKEVKSVFMNPDTGDLLANKKKLL